MDIEIGAEEFIDIPKRPPWDYKLSKKQLETNEVRYFQVRNTKEWNTHSFHMVKQLGDICDELFIIIILKYH